MYMGFDHFFSRNGEKVMLERYDWKWKLS